MTGLTRIADGAGLTAALAQLQRRAPIHYASSAERDGQLQPPQLGDLVLLVDSKTWVWWDGAAWQAFGADASLANRVTTLEGQVSTLQTQTANNTASIQNLSPRVTDLESRMAAVEASTPNWRRGLTTATTTGNEGTFTVTHGLGSIPATVLATAKYQVLGGGAITDVCVIDTVTTTGFTARMANNHGDFVNGVALSVYWLVAA